MPVLAPQHPTVPDLARSGDPVARARDTREGTVPHTVIDSLYVRSWT
ncbi:hypothetical protein [Deinococcus aquiradiocola]|uniref:Uncharacterized protein n=1 Tax=Deinococcus aquiradiocola TaxID=393059 RepID=A0A917PEB3_9DEIO|nr:hypothetical protein [Deinococcus aquiradiocola]GGJ72933.1 hypothetical protein GCM10008939_16610 [Deinococcus aquiradiocola]